jgi:hypothetical protein
MTDTQLVGMILAALVMGGFIGMIIGTIAGRREMRYRLAQDYQNKLTIEVIKATSKAWEDCHNIWETYCAEQGWKLNGVVGATRYEDKEKDDGHQTQHSS